MVKRRKALRTPAERIGQSAVREFGTTEDFSDTAYILPDGRGVRFSTMGDHTDIFLAFPLKERNQLRELMDSELDISTTEFLKRTGSIRVALRESEEAADCLYIHFDSSHKPTAAQLRRLREGVRSLNGQKTLVIESGRSSYEKKFALTGDLDRGMVHIMKSWAPKQVSRMRPKSSTGLRRTNNQQSRFNNAHKDRGRM